MTFLLGWIVRKMKDKPVLESTRVFWFGDGQPRAGWIKGYWWCRAFLVSGATFIVMVWWFLVAAWTKGLAQEGLTRGVYVTMTALTIGTFVPACLALSDERNPRGFVGGITSGLIIGLLICVLSFGIIFSLGLALAGHGPLCGVRAKSVLGMPGAGERGAALAG